MKSKKIVIANETGLQIGPARIIAQAAERCSSKVELIIGNNIVNCRSILNILSASVRNGDEVEIRCSGPDEEQDLEYMYKVFSEDIVGA